MVLVIYRCLNNCVAGSSTHRIHDGILIERLYEDSITHHSDLYITLSGRAYQIGIIPNECDSSIRARAPTIPPQAQAMYCSKHMRIQRPLVLSLPCPSLRALCLLVYTLTLKHLYSIFFTQGQRMYYVKIDLGTWTLHNPRAPVT